MIIITDRITVFPNLNGRGSNVVFDVPGQGCADNVLGLVERIPRTIEDVREEIAEMEKRAGYGSRQHRYRQCF